MDILSVFCLIGSIGLFLYGMKLMSEGLQKIASDWMRNIHASMTQNRFYAMLTGMIITVLVLSSSTTMVMIVSFVNGGLISLAQSLAVILGANVGSTLFSWIISLLGFRYSLSLFVFPIIGLSLPFFQSNNSTRNSIGHLLLGFSLLFLGITVLKENITTLSQNTQLVSFFNESCSWSLGSILLYSILGIILSILTQTNAISFIISLLMCSNGWITFEIGCAIILGANLGTCLSPLLATRKTNTMARRASTGFSIINIIGYIWGLILFYPFCDLISNLCVLMGLGNPDNLLYVSIGLALFHTIFNVINLCILLPFTDKIANLLIKSIEENKNTDESFKLQFLSKGGMMSSGEMALILARKETSRYADETFKMYELLLKMIDEPLGSEHQIQLHHQIVEMEAESDRAEMEIADFLNQVSHKTLSWDGELYSRNLYKMVDELESIADSIFHMSTTLINKQEQRVFFNKEMNIDIRKMLSLIGTSLTHMCHVLSLDDIPTNALNKAYNIEDEINNFRNQLRNAMLDRIDLQQIEYMQNSYFMMLVNECEKIGDYSINVVAAACEAS